MVPHGEQHGDGRLLQQVEANLQDLTGNIRKVDRLPPQVG